VGLVCYGSVHAGEVAVRRWRMTDIGLPLAPPPWRDLAGLSRDAVRLIAPPAVLAVLLIGGWEALSRSSTLSARLLRHPAKCSTLSSARSASCCRWRSPPLGRARPASCWLRRWASRWAPPSPYSALMQAVYPTIVFQLIPKVALAPVFLLWFGTGFGANVISGVHRLPVVVATITGLQAAPPATSGSAAA
jgi:hypothetical protein